MIWTSLIAQGKRRLWMSLFLATLLALVYLHFARFYQGRVSGYIVLLVGIPVVLNWLRAGLGLAYRLDRHPFRTLDLGLDSDRVSPGGSVVLEIVVEARRAEILERLKLELRASRTQTVGTGKQISVLHREDETIEKGLALEPGLRKSYPVRLGIPEGAPYSFRSMEGKIVWSVRVEAEVADWGTLNDEIEITVGPT